MNMKRDLDGNILMQSAVGTKAPTKISLTSGDGDVEIDFETKLISSCGGSKVVVDIKIGETIIEDVPIPAPGAFPIVNVVKIKETGTDATDIVVWPAEDDV